MPGRAVDRARHVDHQRAHERSSERCWAARRPARARASSSARVNGAVQVVVGAGVQRRVGHLRPSRSRDRQQPRLAEAGVVAQRAADAAASPAAVSRSTITRSGGASASASSAAFAVGDARFRGPPRAATAGPLARWRRRGGGRARPPQFRNRTPPDYSSRPRRASASAVGSTSPNSPFRLAGRPVHRLRRDQLAVGARRSWVAIASAEHPCLEPEVDAMRAVVEQQWSVVSPATRPSRRPPAQLLLEVGADERVVHLLRDLGLALAGLGLRLVIEPRRPGTNAIGARRSHGGRGYWRAAPAPPLQRVRDPLSASGCCARPGWIVEGAGRP